MRLTIVTPMSVVLDADDVVHVRAEDRTGAFGMREHHAPFLTVLGVSIIRWRDTHDKEHYAAVRNAVCQILEPNHVEIAARGAALGKSLDKLRESVLADFRKQSARESMSKTSSARLHFALIRQLQRYLDASRTPSRQEPFSPRQEQVSSIDLP